MITEEHLKHWIGEIEYQLNGILNEIDYEKTGTSGVKINDKYVSFEYLNEKASNISGLLIRIKSDMVNDK